MRRLVSYNRRSQIYETLGCVPAAVNPHARDAFTRSEARRAAFETARRRAAHGVHALGTGARRGDQSRLLPDPGAGVVIERIDRAPRRGAYLQARIGAGGIG